MRYNFLRYSLLLPPYFKLTRTTSARRRNPLNTHGKLQGYNAHVFVPLMPSYQTYRHKVMSSYHSCRRTAYVVVPLMPSYQTRRRKVMPSYHSCRRSAHVVVSRGRRGKWTANIPTTRLSEEGKGCALLRPTVSELSPTRSDMTFMWGRERKPVCGRHPLSYTQQRPV